VGGTEVAVGGTGVLVGAAVAVAAAAGDGGTGVGSTPHPTAIVAQRTSAARYTQRLMISALLGSHAPGEVPCRHAQTGMLSALTSRSFQNRFSAGR
jgi:hypothetical protein